MRIALLGAGELTVRTAEILIYRGHEVIIIESDQAQIDEISEQLDCSFLHGDGSNPNVLRELSPEKTDVLFCLTNNDQANLIASLVGRSLGFQRVIPKIEDPAYEGICDELDLRDTIIPSQTIGRYLADMAMGVDILELSTLIKGEARFFSFTVDKKEAGLVEALDLPESARVVCFYRDGDFHLTDGKTSLHKGDEVVILTHSQNLSALRERWSPKQANENESS
jgi:trk system potassium uptake protein TrkA